MFGNKEKLNQPRMYLLRTFDQRTGDSAMVESGVTIHIDGKELNYTIDQGIPFANTGFYIIYFGTGSADSKQKNIYRQMTQPEATQFLELLRNQQQKHPQDQNVQRYLPQAEKDYQVIFGKVADAAT